MRGRGGGERRGISCGTGRGDGRRCRNGWCAGCGWACCGRARAGVCGCAAMPQWRQWPEGRLQLTRAAGVAAMTCVPSASGAGRGGCAALPSSSSSFRPPGVSRPSACASRMGRDGGVWELLHHSAAGYGSHVRCCCMMCHSIYTRCIPCAFGGQRNVMGDMLTCCITHKYTYCSNTSNIYWPAVCSICGCLACLTIVFYVAHNTYRYVWQRCAMVFLPPPCAQLQLPSRMHACHAPTLQNSVVAHTSRCHQPHTLRNADLLQHRGPCVCTRICTRATMLPGGALLKLLESHAGPR